MYGEKSNQLHAAQRQLLRPLNILEKRIVSKQKEESISIQRVKVNWPTCYLSISKMMQN